MVQELQVVQIFFSRNNLIKDLPPELEQCSKLRDLVLSFNSFQKIPEVVYSLKSLETIVASDNQVCICFYYNSVAGPRGSILCTHKCLDCVLNYLHVNRQDLTLHMMLYVVITIQIPFSCTD